MKVLELKDHMKDASPTETAAQLDSLLKNNNIRGTKNTETIIWIISYAFSRLVHEVKDINTAVGILDSIISQYMDPEVYPDPQKFDPERFTPDQKASRDSVYYMPFGQGPRMCIAMRLALLEMKVKLDVTTSTINHTTLFH